MGLVLLLSGLVVTIPGADTAFAAPTVLAFLPLSGPVGTSVAITGTGFTGATAVTFNGAPASFTVDLSTLITATVPVGATDGPIAVTTPTGTDASLLSFDVTGVQMHEREVTLELLRHLVAVGRITAQDGFDDCEAGVTVRVQRRRPHGGWRGVGVDRSNTKGVFRETRERSPRRVPSHRRAQGAERGQQRVPPRSFATREAPPLAAGGDGQVAIAVGSALSVVRPQAPPPFGIGPGRAR
jgi:hypothetical protein